MASGKDDKKDIKKVEELKKEEETEPTKDGKDEDISKTTVEKSRLTNVEQRPQVGATVQLSEVWLTPKETFSCSVGGTTYQFEEGKRIKVNTEVRDILHRANKIKSFG